MKVIFFMFPSWQNIQAAFYHLFYKQSYNLQSTNPTAERTRYGCSGKEFDSGYIQSPLNTTDHKAFGKVLLQKGVDDKDWHKTQEQLCGTAGLLVHTP